MNGKLKLLALLLILPLLMVVVTHVADADSGDGKSCKNKSFKSTHDKTSYKMSKNFKKLQI